jgi:ElaB/YqjD/DUF883 family membrane-anchored ribosome-binding protein
MHNSSHIKSRAKTIADDAPSVAQGLQDAGHAVKTMANDSVDALRETAQEFIDQGRDKIREMGENVETHVQEQPVKSVLIAAGVGFLIGLFFLRHKD